MHRAILLTTTDFFETALSPSSGFLESSTKHIVLQEHTSRAVEAFLEYCYTGQYDFKESDPPILDYEVYRLSGYVLAPDAKAFALRMMKARLILLANRGRLVDDSWAAPEKEGGKLWPKIVRAVYETTEEGSEIRELVVDAVVMALGIHGIGFVGDEFAEIMKDYGEFSTAVLLKHAKSTWKGGSTRTYTTRQVIASVQCGNCAARRRAVKFGASWECLGCECGYGQFLHCKVDTIIQKEGSW